MVCPYNGILYGMKRNEKLDRETLRRDLKCPLMNVRSHSERTICYMTPTKWHSGGKEKCGNGKNE